MKCGGMRASTLGCRFLDSCGDSLGVESSFSLGVESSFKDTCILAAVRHDDFQRKTQCYTSQ